MYIDTEIRIELFYHLISTVRDDQSGDGNKNYLLLTIFNPAGNFK